MADTVDDCNCGPMWSMTEECTRTFTSEFSDFNDSAKLTFRLRTDFNASGDKEFVQFRDVKIFLEYGTNEEEEGEAKPEEPVALLDEAAHVAAEEQGHSSAMVGALTAVGALVVLAGAAYACNRRKQVQKQTEEVLEPLL